MKSTSLHRAAARLLALLLTCSLLVLPAAADDVTITLDRSELTLQTTQTDGVQLTATVDPPGAAVTWKSSSEAVATVSADGLVRPVAPGTAYISARVGGAYKECRVTVTEPKIPVTSITLDQDSLNVTAGDPSVQLRATVLPENATDKSVVFSSEDDSIVRVDSFGNLTFLKEGRAQITARTNDGTGLEAYCLVRVAAAPAVTSVTLNETSLNLSRGESFSLTATLEGAAAAEGVRWTSSDPGTVSVSGGRVTVSARAETGRQVSIYAQAVADVSKYAICAVTVIEPRAPKVTDLTITSPATDDRFRYVDPGETMTLTAVASPIEAPAADRTITWSSSDTSVATVDPDTGVVRGVAPGEATITARTGGADPLSASRDIEVSGILLSYLKRSSSGGKGQTIQLTEKSIEPIYQYRDISVAVRPFGLARDKVVDWESSNTTVASVANGRVTANYPGEAIITAGVANEPYTAKFSVRVSEDVADAINVDMGSRAVYSFSGLLSELNKRSQSKAGAPLDCVYNLKVSTEDGVLYYKYTSPSSPGHGVGGTERYYYQASGQGQMALKDVSFVPLPGISGTAIVDYSAEATSGAVFSGTIRIEIPASSGDITYSTEMDRPVALAAEHFSAICMGRSGRPLGFVTFSQPSASRGTLYYNYSPGGQFAPKVDSSTRYYASSRPSVDDITFVPAEGYTGDVSIPYRCIDSSGAAYSGTITVTVYGSNGSGGSRDVEYSTGLDQRLVLDGSDFDDACQRSTGYGLDYIRFDSLPSSGKGTLYLNYTSSSSTRVTTDRNYYRTSTPRISSISFVPDRDYKGTVSIPFTGTNTNGRTFSGELVIHVADGTGTVHYDTPRDRSVTFEAGDFNDACRRINGETLDYLRFTDLPRSSAGTLYYDRGGSDDSRSRVSTGTDYRRSGSPALSDITFVPADGYEGTVSIPFTAYDDSGDRFEGDVTITVGGGDRVISYRTAANSSVRFNASDFNSACRSATGDTLDYIRFRSVSNSRGTLYQQYDAAGRTGSSASTGTNYYRSGGSRLIDDLTFAANSASGTAAFDYTGYSTRGDSFSGTVEIQISGGSGTPSGTAGTAVRYTGCSAPIRFRASDFQTACQAALGTTLASVQFSTLPGAGRLYQNYASPARTGTGVTGVTRYNVQALDQISYVPRAEYQGTVTIPYTAYDTQGAACSGTVEILLSNGYCTTPFTDVASGWDWAKPSIEYLRQGGISGGYRDNTFRPGRSISRGEFTLMVCRAFQFSSSNSSGFPDVPSGSAYAGAVAAARELGIVQGNNGRFHPDQPITRQSAMTMICRALEAAGQSVPAADVSLLSSYADGGQVSAFARPAVASLIQMGAVRGNSSMRLNPTAAISRAEMAVILHRVLAR